MNNPQNPVAPKLGVDGVTTGPTLSDRPGHGRSLLLDTPRGSLEVKCGLRDEWQPRPKFLYEYDVRP